MNAPAVDSRRRVVITGMGAVTPVGLDAPSTWQALVAGRSGVRHIELFPASTYPVRIAGQVPVEDPSTLVPGAEASLLSRQGAFGLAAAREAAAMAGLDESGVPGHRRSVSVGATAGRPPLSEMAEFFHRFTSDEALYRPSVEDVRVRREHTPATLIAAETGATGGTRVFSTACTASGHAMGEAFRQIQDGTADVVVTGGYDSLITWLDVLGFSLLGALTGDHADEPERASRPFSEDRSGFVLGEGATMFVMEEREQALARGATILAEVSGYSSTMNAYRMTDPPPGGGAIVTCVERALEEAGLAPEAVGYVAAHGTSTPGNDITETQAIKAVFGDSAPALAISSVKSAVGHLTAAAAALGALGAVGVLRDAQAPPTINLEHPDPRLDLNYVPLRAQEVHTDAVLVNAFAFGGTNTCLILTRGDRT